MKLHGLFLLFFLTASLASAQSAAFISRDKLYPSLKGYSAKQANLDTLRLKFSKEIQQEQQSLQKKYEAIVGPYAPKQNETFESLQMRLSKTDAERLKLLQDEQKLHESRIKSYNNQINEQYSRDMKPYMDSVNKELDTYARKNKIDMIWFLEDIMQALPYYNKSKDITAIIAENINKLLP